MIQTSEKRRYDAVLCDVDGCLSSEAGGPLDTTGMTRLAEYNRRAAEVGDRPFITLCTGRPVSYADCLSRLIDNLQLPVVAENGVWLYHAGTNDWRIDPGITHEHLVAMRELSDFIEETFGPDGVRLQPGKTASLSPYHEDPEFLATVVDPIRAHCEERDYPIRVSPTWNYINCDLTFVSKRTGIARFQKWTGLGSDRLAGIGDTPSDLAIAESVACFAVPANRNPELDSSAQIISEHAELEGVLDILEHWVGVD